MHRISLRRNALARTAILAVAALLVCSCHHSHSTTSGDLDACSRASDAGKAFAKFRQDYEDVNDAAALTDLDAMTSALDAALKGAHDSDLVSALNIELAAVAQARQAIVNNKGLDTSSLIIADGEVGNVCSEILAPDIAAP